MWSGSRQREVEGGEGGREEGSVREGKGGTAGKHNVHQK